MEVKKYKSEEIYPTPQEKPKENQEKSQEAQNMNLFLRNIKLFEKAKAKILCQFKLLQYWDF